MKYIRNYEEIKSKYKVVMVVIERLLNQGRVPFLFKQDQSRLELGGKGWMDFV